MDREKNYGNFHLNKKKLEKLREIFSNNEEIDKLSIYTTRALKEDGIKIKKVETFYTFDEMIEYINQNSIVKINLINIELRYKKNRLVAFEYNGYDYNWVFRYQEKDTYTDSIIYNLNNLFKHQKLSFISTYFNILLWIISLGYLIIRYCLDFNNFYFDLIYLIVWSILLILILLNNKNAYKENKFIERNKDSIILSIIFYILGFVSPYIVNLIQLIFK